MPAEASDDTSLQRGRDGTRTPLPASRFWCISSDRAHRVGLAVLALWTTASFFLLPFLLPYFAGPILIATVPVLTLLLGWPARVVVGNDGILCGPFFRRRFISYSDVHALRMLAKGVEVRVAGGEDVDLYTGGLSRRKMAALGGTISERFAEWSHLAAPPQTADVVVDPGPEVPYRSGTDPARLLKTAQAPWLLPDVRMTAARKLGDDIDEATRGLFRELAHASAEPRVRALFMKIADGSKSEGRLPPADE